MSDRETLQIRYGNYTHEVGEVELSYMRHALFGDSRVPYAERIEIDLHGVLVADSVAAMDAKVGALASAYAFNGRDFSVVTSDGTATRLAVASADTNGGVFIVTPPSFPDNKNAAYVTFLPYQIQLMAELPITNPATVLTKWQETLTFSGGGPEYVLKESRLGRPQKERVTRFKVYSATQQGSAAGLYLTPTPPAAIWPADLIKAPQVTSIGGRLVGSGGGKRFMHKGIRWRYDFQSALAMFGEPNHWGSE